MLTPINPKKADALSGGDILICIQRIIALWQIQSDKAEQSKSFLPEQVLQNVIVVLAWRRGVLCTRLCHIFC